MRHSTRQKLFGLFITSLVAWLGSFCILFLVPQLEFMLTAPLLGREYSWDIHPQAMRTWVYLSAIIGLPIAIIVTIVIGFPLWKISEESGDLSFSRAIYVGAVAGTIVGAAPLLLGQLLATYSGLFEDGSYSRTWMYGYKLSVNGRLSPLGWALAIKDVLYTILLGMVCGGVCRWVAGRPRENG